jgi:hypothetical protein
MAWHSSTTGIYIAESQHDRKSLVGNPGQNNNSPETGKADVGAVDIVNPITEEDHGQEAKAGFTKSRTADRCVGRG